MSALKIFLRKYMYIMWGRRKHLVYITNTHTHTHIGAVNILPVHSKEALKYILLYARNNCMKWDVALCLHIKNLFSKLCGCQPAVPLYGSHWILLQLLRSEGKKKRLSLGLWVPQVYPHNSYIFKNMWPAAGWPGKLHRLHCQHIGLIAHMKGYFPLSFI